MIEKLKSLLVKYKEPILYLFFGGVTTLVNILVFYVCRRFLSLELGLANVIAWIIAVLVAFLTNKLFVFESKAMDMRTLIREGAKFFGARLATLIMETAFLYLTVQVLHWPEMLMKIIANILVIVANYVLSKLIIFKRKDS